MANQVYQPEFQYADYETKQKSETTTIAKTNKTEMKWNETTIPSQTAFITSACFSWDPQYYNPLDNQISE